ncbi:MAG: 50S ribosomal protein L30 [Rickettsiales bacterium]|jgi:large subunit ribosomal protein L30|nr:50S ribosomal protein L30 [Rickettsiales bacterium]
MKQETVKVTLKKSLIGREQKMRECVKGLGLRQVGSSKVLARTPETLGLINKVKHLVEIEG